MRQPIFNNPSFRFLIFFILVLIFLFVGRVYSIDQEGIQNYLGRIPVVWSGIVFVVLYVVLSFFIWLGPKDIFKIVGVLVYGLYTSTLLIYIAEMINVLALFSLSRFMGRDFVAQKLPGKIQQIDQAVSRTGFFSIFFARFFPIIPFRFLDIGFGLTKIRLRKYWSICLLSSPLRIFFVQLFLSLGLDTVMNPQKLEQYLTAHPHIMGVTFLYSIGALVMVFIWKMKSKKG